MKVCSTTNDGGGGLTGSQPTFFNMEVTINQLWYMIQRLPSAKYYEAPTINIIVPYITADFNLNLDIKITDESKLDYLTFHKIISSDGSVEWVLRL